MAIPVAVQLYSVRGDMAEDMLATLKKVKEMGYAGVEFAGLFDHSASEVKEMLEEVGLVPVSAHVPYAELMADMEETVKKYVEIGCKYIAIPYLDESLRPGKEKFFEVLEDIRKIGKVCKDNGVILLYHNHDFEFVKIGDVYGLDYMYSEIPADLLQTELDCCWVKVSGEDPAAYIRKYSGRAPVVHLKDFSGTKSESMYELIGIQKKVESTGAFSFQPVGSGVQDFPEILKASEEAGAEWVVVEMDKPSEGLTPMQCIEKSRTYLKSIGY